MDINDYQCQVMNMIMVLINLNRNLTKEESLLYNSLLRNARAFSELQELTTRKMVLNEEKSLDTNEGNTQQNPKT
jgi:hypothetical protein